MAILLIRYAEIGLKSAPVRRRFENTLKDNMLDRLMDDGVEALVSNKGARFYVEATDIDAAVRSVRKVFGVASISVAETCTSKMDDMCATAAEYSLSKLKEGQSFAVKARREGSQEYTSVDIGREVGSAIFLANESKGVKVDLTNPDVVFYVEARDNKAYIFQDYIRCHAGLPVGTQGKVIAIINDDPRDLASAWLMMKRGCRVLVRGKGDISPLKQYDSYTRILEDKDSGKNIMGYVMGTRMEDIDKIDMSGYDLPIYFPTIGMNDEQVDELVQTIKSGL